ncbi:MAG: ABC transporter substrate-binding protein [Clostridia bacterium]|nr:ABC transporter substrate-binding protein [Clostridia bacterium]
MTTAKRALALCLVLALLGSLCACGRRENRDRIARIAVPFAYESLDPHKEYHGWYTSIYGITETLFQMDDDGDVVPCLAKSAKQDGTTWTIRLNRHAKFSNGKELTAEMVIRNLKRTIQVNDRYADYQKFRFEAPDIHTVVIHTPAPYPTLKNELVSPCLAILDLDSTPDPDNAIIGTGPFVLRLFQPETVVSVDRNKNYWNGKVKLAGAEFLYMEQDAPKLFAMQQGSIDAVTNVTSDALKAFEENPGDYDIVSTPGTRLLFFYLNETTLDHSVRKVINGCLDKKYAIQLLNGVLSPSNGPFDEDKPYGKANEVKKLSPEEIDNIMTGDGYQKNSDGFYEKDGVVLTVRLCGYSGRNYDALAKLMAKQLNAAGIKTTITIEKDPDATYMKSRDFDVGFYSLISDKYGDPYEFLDKTMRSGAPLNAGSFDNRDVQTLLEQMKTATGHAVRPKLANNIVRIAMEDEAYGYVGTIKKVTVLRHGLSNISEHSPYDYYCLTKDSVFKE